WFIKVSKNGSKPEASRKKKSIRRTNHKMHKRHKNKYTDLQQNFCVLCAFCGSKKFLKTARNLRRVERKNQSEGVTTECTEGTKINTQTCSKTSVFCVPSVVPQLFSQRFKASCDAKKAINNKN
ncbi:MAG: hypothetical protein ACSHYA_14865, partial [Opitutaceae bacterium]